MTTPRADRPWHVEQAREGESVSDTFSRLLAEPRVTFQVKQIHRTEHTVLRVYHLTGPYLGLVVRDDDEGDYVVCGLVSNVTHRFTTADAALAYVGLVATAPLREESTYVYDRETKRNLERKPNEHEA